MLADDLRKSVMQDAIQGKIVPQDSNDEPASVLLERIKLIKEKLLKDKKIKKENKSKPITEDDILFDIPESWQWVRIGETCCNITYGTSEKSLPFGKMPVLRMGNIQSGKIDYTNLVYTSNEADMETYKLEKDDLLFNRTNSKDLVGKTAIYKAEMPVIYAGYLIRITPVIICSDYLNYVMQSSYYKNYCWKVKSDGVEQSNINAVKLKDFIYPLPPLAEQYRIVSKLEVLLAKIDEFEIIEKELEQIKNTFPYDMKKSLLQAAIQGKLSEQLSSDSSVDELLDNIKKEREQLLKEKKIKKEKLLSTVTVNEMPFDIPENWRWVRLIDVSNINGGYAFKSHNFKDEGVRVIRISDFDEFGFKNHKIVRHEYSNSLSQFLLEEKNILLCMTGGTVGKSYFIKSIPEPMMTNQRVATIIISKLVVEEYINYVILSPEIQKIINNKKNSTNDNISMDDIKNFLIPIPPLEEQKRIVEKLEKLLPCCDVLSI